MKLQLKINNEWAVLPEGISMSIHKTSPLFNAEAGDISYPFELNLEANRHIFKNLADTHGYIRLREFHGLPAEIWYDGMQVFNGRTEVDESIDFDGDNISINIISANKTFAEMIDGMNCRDVEVKDDVIFGRMTKQRELVNYWPEIYFKTFRNNGAAASQMLGYRYRAGMTNEEILSLQNQENITVQVNTPSELSAVHLTFTGLEIQANIDIPRIYMECTDKTDAEYPSSSYCNFRLARPNGDGTNDSEGSTGSGYAVTNPGGINCAPNFFVLYFLDCLFQKLGIDCEKSAVDAVEDLRRLFMLNVWPDGKDGGNDDYTTDYYFDSEDGAHIPRIAHMGYPKFFLHNMTEKVAVWNPGLDFQRKSLKLCDAIATSKNFPDADVKDVVESLAKGFGIIFDYNQETKQMTLSLKRDIMRNAAVDDTRLKVTDEYITRQLYGGVELTYGNDDDTAYNYDMTQDANGKVYGGKSQLVEKNGYSAIVSARRSRFDSETKFDTHTGNAFRVKVNEDTGDEPQLFEVGGYNPCKYGIDKNGLTTPEKIELPFTPVTINDIWGWRKSIADGADGETSYIPSGEEDSELCVFFDEENYNTQNDLMYMWGQPGGGLKESAKAVGSIGDNSAEETEIFNNGLMRITCEFVVKTQIAGEGSYDLAQNNMENPLANADVGLQLGIIRGSGADAHMEYINNYDGEGNDTWVNIPGSKGGASADSVTMWGTPYDYNGTEQGGTEGHLSLKLDARKVKSYDENGDPVFYPMDSANAKRGLVPQLLEEYLYFLAHKTPVTLNVHGTLTELMHLPFLKRVKIGEHIGFIYTIDFNIEEGGVQEATIVLWELNK